MNKEKLYNKYNQMIMDFGRLNLEIEERKGTLDKLKEEIAKTVGLLQEVLKEEAEEKQKKAKEEKDKVKDKAKPVVKTEPTPEAKPEETKEPEASNVVPIKREDDGTEPKAS